MHWLGLGMCKIGQALKVGLGLNTGCVFKLDWCEYICEYLPEKKKNQI